jgi:hypothetical protein
MLMVDGFPFVWRTSSADVRFRSGRDTGNELADKTVELNGGEKA